MSPSTTNMSTTTPSTTLPRPSPPPSTSSSTSTFVVEEDLEKGEDDPNALKKIVTMDEVERRESLHPAAGTKEALSSSTGEAEKHDPFLVTMEGREHLHPHTWSPKYRWFLTSLAGLLVFNSAFASSAPSGLISDIRKDFDASAELGILIIAIFVAGYTLGPLLWGPLSERYGRRIVFLAAWVPYTLLQIGAALSPNMGSLVVFRFIAGCFAAAPLTNSGGLVSDLWDADTRGVAMAVFSLMPSAGPAVAPVISGYMSVAGVNWRVIFWLLFGFSGACFVAVVLLVPETYVPYILFQEARRLRKETGDDRWHSELDSTLAAETKRDVLNRTVLKPVRMIIEEPILAVMTAYISLNYGTIYLLFAVVPIIFVQGHGLNSGESGLTFLSMLFGSITAIFIYIFYYNPDYKRIHHSLHGRSVPPEVRLKPLCYGAPVFALCFFWIGWSSYSHVHIASPIIALFFLGGCIMFLFLSITNYIVDCYLSSAASALSINTIVRSSFGFAFPMFAQKMFGSLGTPIACSILGGVAVLFIPAPFLLMKYGKQIRGMSRNAVVREDE